MEPGIPKTLSLFEAFGIELEYMIVDADSLDVRPMVDELLHEEAGAYVGEVEKGAIAWSNELALHVVELKTNGPAANLDGLHHQFQQQVNAINKRLDSHNAMLLPTAMHPWMNPDTEMKLWPHDYNTVYEAYNRIFDCRGHGWANLQSTHINVPFTGDAEFEKLHAAIRVLLPLLPAIAASSPFADGVLQPEADHRIEVYRTNSRRIPSVTGAIIPERVFDEATYEADIFQRMYADIKPYDSENLLQEQWLNSRGAIARFDRGSIEIRLLDIQECPLADLAICRLVVDTLKALISERWTSRTEQKKWHEHDLRDLLLKIAEDGEKTTISDAPYSRLFGLQTNHPVPAQQIWTHIFKELYAPEQVEENVVLQAIQTIIEKGTLATRIRQSLGGDASRTAMKATYSQLAQCLQGGTLFTG